MPKLSLSCTLSFSVLSFLVFLSGDWLVWFGLVSIVQIFWEDVVVWGEQDLKLSGCERLLDFILLFFFFSAAIAVLFFFLAVV